MKLNIRHVKKAEYQVDLEDLPGSAPIGIGRTPEEALGALFLSLVIDQSWLKHIKTGNLEIKYHE